MFKLWLRYHQLVEEHLNEQIWKCNTWDQYLALKGEKRNLERLRRAPEEIAQAREAIMQQIEEETKNGK